jgi:hypothetical protein
MEKSLENLIVIELVKKFPDFYGTKSSVLFLQETITAYAYSVHN